MQFCFCAGLILHSLARGKDTAQDNLWGLFCSPLFLCHNSELAGEGIASSIFYGVHSSRRGERARNSPILGAVLHGIGVYIGHYIGAYAIMGHTSAIKRCKC
uniref:Uncharacterized protein n=1 Tax=virus sp. ctqEG8 TaxID=2827998 RepID=A0A8S5RFY1_9VIRU|nr:MAG TPA: hypothetical protein [virus sp. ctqEG8]